MSEESDGIIYDDLEDLQSVQCGKPCPPDDPCDECAHYWQRMRDKGFWDGARHRWTAKGMREMLK